MSECEHVWRKIKDIPEHLSGGPTEHCARCGGLRMPDFPLHSESRRDLPGCPKSVPWAFIVPHRAQVWINHEQHLERLAQRGGLGVGEMLDVIRARRWATTRDTPEALTELLGLIETFRKL